MTCPMLILFLIAAIIVRAFWNWGEVDQDVMNEKSRKANRNRRGVIHTDLNTILSDPAARNELDKIEESDFTNGRGRGT